MINSLGTQSYVILIDDSNDDGRLDLAVTFVNQSSVGTLIGYGNAVINANNNIVSIYFGDGNNSFIEQTTFSTELNPRWIATADFKNDQHSDLTITNYNSNSMRVSIAAGSGSFEAYETLNTSSGPNSIAIGDFNSDNNV
ncbi:unnamed protein product, partial [Rotaria magnacalcarata]